MFREEKTLEKGREYEGALGRERREGGGGAVASGVEGVDGRGGEVPTTTTTAAAYEPATF